MSDNIVYNEIREFVLGAIYEGIPGVGWVASGFIRVLWPEKESETNVWDTIKSRVDAVVAKKISTQVYNRDTAELTGIRDQLNAYKADPTSETYQTTLGIIRSSIPTFQEKGYETQLLPLFTQVVNIYLMFLREGVLNSQALQLTSKDRTALQDELTAKNITLYSDYANKWYKAGIPSASDWAKQNDYTREYTLGVLDYLPYWPLMDPIKYAPPVTNPPKLTRQIFSEPQGDGGRYFTESVIAATDLQAKDGKISHITIYSRKDFETWVQGAQVTYGNKKASKVGSGVSSEYYGAAAARYFDDDMGRLRPKEIPVSDLNPITEVWGYRGSNTYDINYGIGFTFKDGSKTPLIGAKSQIAFQISYPGHILSNISALGVSDSRLINGGKGYAMGRAVFGFRLADSYPLTTLSLYSLYKRNEHGDVYDFANTQTEYEAKVAAGWTGQGVIARLLDSSGKVGLYVARNKTDTDVVRLFVGAESYSAFNDSGWSKDGALGYVLEEQNGRFGPTQPLYLLTAGSPARTMIEFKQHLYEAQQTVGWRGDDLRSAALRAGCQRQVIGRSPLIPNSGDSPSPSFPSSVSPGDTPVPAAGPNQDPPYTSANSVNNTRAACTSAVSNPSVNQP